ncbi:hypothetical protein CRV15_30095 (plasmid) [Streptomyces clavuligerus]|uniref:Uncharacterized protein n=1 Tax=Streptomyces clavuligerus TaxID=1901 RepID=B5GZJ8_STRCL|nr:hypothetical protein SSCG_04815 [Streptomyces clavuligerus]EFG03900.1 Hypothetical protein SCLAV_p0410 [Streptomyces clavuligerus]QCS09856.1 hypothetical protein CRV15_30095 [Streptomyces clavuligerus]QPJ98101.1 hypothetical protein GE265_34340 [Streptomyces clavuligerus]
MRKPGEDATFGGGTGAGDEVGGVLGDGIDMDLLGRRRFRVQQVSHGVFPVPGELGVRAGEVGVEHGTPPGGGDLPRLRPGAGLKYVTLCGFSTTCCGVRWWLCGEAWAE